MKESTLKRFFRLAQFDQHLTLHRLDCLASHGSLELYDFVRTSVLRTLPQEHVRPSAIADWKGPDRSRISARATVQPEMLAMAEDAQLEGTVHTREAGVGGHPATSLASALEAALMPNSTVTGAMASLNTLSPARYRIVASSAYYA